MTDTPLEKVFVQIIHADREAVWEALTSPEFTARYWHSTRVHSTFTPGSAIQFLVAGDTVGCEGKILVAEEPSRLAYTWHFPRNPDVNQEAPSRVTFTLETLRDDAGRSATRLTVVHDRFPAGSRVPRLIEPGWPLVLAGLKTLLETGDAVDFSAMA